MGLRDEVREMEGEEAGSGWLLEWCFCRVCVGKERKSSHCIFQEPPKVLSGLLQTLVRPLELGCINLSAILSEIQIKDYPTNQL